jgi:hypothetical protein
MIIATANGGMEDCVKFLNQIIEYNEGLLTPANFVQSTSNAAAARLRSLQKITNIILPMSTGDWHLKMLDGYSDVVKGISRYSIPVGMY